MTFSNLAPVKTARRDPDFDNRIKEFASQGFRGQVLVAHHGKIVLDAACGFADAGGSVVVTHETGFGVASVTKNFTAAAILKLREAGLLQMNSKLKTLSDDGYVLLAAIIEETSGRS